MSVLLVPPALMAMPAGPATKLKPTLTPVSPTALAVASRFSSALSGGKLVFGSTPSSKASLRRAVAPPVTDAKIVSLLGSVAFMDAFALPNMRPTPLKVSPTVLPGATTKSLAVSTGFNAVRAAELTVVSPPLIVSSLAVAAISRARTRIRSLPVMTNGPHFESTLNKYWKFSSPTRSPMR